VDRVWTGYGFKWHFKPESLDRVGQGTDFKKKWNTDLSLLNRGKVAVLRWTGWTGYGQGTDLRQILLTI